MICPDCQTDNIPGVDSCESCGSDLTSLDLPGVEDAFTEHILTVTLANVDAEEPPAVSPSDPVALAIHGMQKNRVASVLVKEGGKLVGILTERDVLLKAAGAEVDLNALAVRELMTPDPVVLKDSDTLAVALHSMSVGGFRHIPVISGGEAKRVLSIRDVVRHISPFIPGQPSSDA